MGETKLVNQKTVRFSTAPWYKPGIPVIIGGLGTIGSWLSLFLGRQECELHLFDMDTIEEANMAGQFYLNNDIGFTKVAATSTHIFAFSENTQVYEYEEYKKNSLKDKYMFSCFDNLEARKLMFENWCTVQGKDKIFIDGRLNAENLDVFFVTPDRIQQYKNDLYDDTQIEPLVCSFKSTSHCGAMCAGVRHHPGSAGRVLATVDRRHGRAAGSSAQGDPGVYDRG